MPHWKFISKDEAVTEFEDSKNHITNIVQNSKGEWGFRLEDGETYGPYTTKALAAMGYHKFIKTNYA